MILVDREGVPRIVQKLQYFYGSFIIKVIYFDGQRKWLEPAEEVEITDVELTEVQRLACERDAEKVWAPAC